MLLGTKIINAIEIKTNLFINLVVEQGQFYYPVTGSYDLQLRIK